MFHAGDTLSHFRLVERIGEGDIGEVWEAADTRSERKVAVKILLPPGDPQTLARLRRAADAIGALDHPNILAIDGIEEADGADLVVTPLVDGPTLASLVPEGGFALPTFREHALRMTGAVAAAHERGIIHRSLTPRKIMFDANGEMKILDFGLIEVRERELEPDTDPGDAPTLTLTREGRDRESLPFVSPEKMQGKPLDQRSDVYSLGVILYVMASGQRPFEGESPADTLVAILRDRPQPVSEINPDLPADVDDVVFRCMEKNREHRYPSARELHDDLARLGQS